MKIDTLGVQAFVAIADHGSFGRAAQSLYDLVRSASPRAGP